MAIGVLRTEAGVSGIEGGSQGQEYCVADQG
jgi:hypothetical protein